MPLSHRRLWSALDSLARREGLSPSGLACRAGLDPTALNPSKRYGPGEPARPRWPSTESLNRILEATDTTLAEFAVLADDAAPRVPTAPLLGLAQAGQDGFFDEAGFPIGESWDQTELPAPKEGLFSLRISGDSMAPLYREGDRVVVDRDRSDIRTGDRVVVRTVDGETLAKEMGRLTSKALTLISINPAYPPRNVPRSDVAWMARILWVSQ